MLAVAVNGGHSSTLDVGTLGECIVFFSACLFGAPTPWKSRPISITKVYTPCNVRASPWHSVTMIEVKIFVVSWNVSHPRKYYIIYENTLFPVTRSHPVDHPARAHQILLFLLRMLSNDIIKLLLEFHQLAWPGKANSYLDYSGSAGGAELQGTIWSSASWGF